MKRYDGIACLALLLAGVLDCGAMSRIAGIQGNGIKAERRIDLPDFSGVTVSGALEVELICGEDPGLRLSGDENLLELIHADVEGDQLVLYNEECISPRLPMKVTVFAPSVSCISISGASEMLATQIDCERLDLSLSGASDLRISGTAEMLEASLSGASDLMGHGLSVSRACLVQSGASDAAIHVEEFLEASLSGASDLTYTGSPERVSAETSGAAEVIHKGSRPANVY